MDFVSARPLPAHHGCGQESKRDFLKGACAIMDVLFGFEDPESEEAVTRQPVYYRPVPAPVTAPIPPSAVMGGLGFMGEMDGDELGEMMEGLEGADASGDLVIGIDMLGRKVIRKRRTGPLPRGFRPMKGPGGRRGPLFTPGVRAQVNAFQLKHGLFPVDGAVGPKTRSALQMAPGPTLKLGSRGPQVALLISALARQGTMAPGQSATQASPGAAPIGPVKNGTIITVTSTPTSSWYLRKRPGGYMVHAKSRSRPGRKWRRAVVARMIVSPAKSTIVVYPLRRQAIGSTVMELIRGRLPPLERTYAVSTVPPRVVARTLVANRSTPTPQGRLANIAMAAQASLPTLPGQTFIPPAAPVTAPLASGGFMPVSAPGGGGGPGAVQDAMPEPESAPPEEAAPAPEEAPPMPEEAPPMPEEAAPAEETPAEEAAPAEEAPAEEAAPPSPDEVPPEEAASSEETTEPEPGHDEPTEPMTPSEAQVEGMLYGVPVMGAVPPPISWETAHAHGLAARGYGTMEPGTGILSGATQWGPYTSRDILMGAAARYHHWKALKHALRRFVHQYHRKPTPAEYGRITAHVKGAVGAAMGRGMWLPGGGFYRQNRYNPGGGWPIRSHGGLGPHVPPVRLRGMMPVVDGMGNVHLMHGDDVVQTQGMGRGTTIVSGFTAGDDAGEEMAYDNEAAGWGD